jgi:hypothetical protein
MPGSCALPDSKEPVARRVISWLISSINIFYTTAMALPFEDGMFTLVFCVLPWMAVVKISWLMSTKLSSSA